MKTGILFCLCVTVLAAAPAFGQQDSDAFGISFSGFVKTDMIYDTRQTVNVRDGHFLLYPSPEMFDENQVDINDNPTFNMLSIQTRLRGNITGPDAFGAKTRGAIEGEFFGATNGDVNGFRLRHAFVNLDWGGTALLVGHTWHPMFVTGCFPGVVSFNTGVPFQPFSRNPQVRLTQSVGGMKLIAAAASQREFPSNGPDDPSTTYLRNAIIPNLHLQAQYATGGSLFGAGVDYKSLRPRLVTEQNVSTDEQISAVSLIGYAKLALDPITIKVEGVMGNNLGDLLMLGGYAVSSMDATTGTAEYTPLGSFSMWGEIIYGKEVEMAVFAGFSQNQGSEDNVVGPYYARGANIDNVMRVSPRVQWTSGKTRIATELEYTAAAYGTPNDADKAAVENTTTVSNVRLLVAVFYFF
jgi:hypothetical protein